jgi:ATP sulfurylase
MFFDVVGVDFHQPGQEVVAAEVLGMRDAGVRAQFVDAAGAGQKGAADHAFRRDHAGVGAAQ